MDKQLIILELSDSNDCWICFVGYIKFIIMSSNKKSFGDRISALSFFLKSQNKSNNHILWRALEWFLNENLSDIHVETEKYESEPFGKESEKVTIKMPHAFIFQCNTFFSEAHEIIDTNNYALLSKLGKIQYEIRLNLNFKVFSATKSMIRNAVMIYPYIMFTGKFNDADLVIKDLIKEQEEVIDVPYVIFSPILELSY
ncbi:TPA_asm: M [Cypripedium betacytorhabdovirus 1]|nr:TPA_asm: M [Cypripedium betacytorhabdovirus 1]